MEVSQLRGQLEMAAMVATNLTALTNGGLYVFLRTCHSSNIGRKGYFEMDREKKQKQQEQTRKRQMRKSPMTETYTNQIEQPVSPPPRVYQPYSPADTNRESMIAESQIGLAQTMSGTGAQSVTGSPRKVHTRKASYSVFPQQQPQQTPALNPKPLSVLPAATYTPPTLARGDSAEVNDEDIEAMEYDIMRRDISSLLPPPVLMPGFVPSHQRDSSMASSATVQIGLRLSNVNDMPTRGVAGTSYLQERAPTPRPTSSIYPKSIIAPFAAGANGLAAAAAALQDVDSSPRRTSVRVGSSVWVDPAKQLPPAPLQPAKAKKERKAAKGRESQMLLSPMVYSPEGPGNSTTMPSPSDKDPRMSPLDETGSATKKRPSEWI